MRGLLALVAMLVVSAAWAQAYPAKPIRLVVPNPPGGVDITLRLVQKDMSEDLGQPLVFDYRPGANGFIGTENVARSAPDGYTLLATSSASLIVGPVITGKAPFDPLKDFSPITALSGGVTVLIARPTLGAGTVKELIELARRNPGKLTFGSGGVGTSNHLYGEIVNSFAGVSMLHVPYKGGGPSVQGLMSGEIDMVFITVQSVRSVINAGKVKLIAVLIGERFPGLPGTPDITETLPGFPFPASWTGVLGPAGLPPAVTARVSASAVKALAVPEVRAKFDEDTRVLASTPQAFAAQLKADVERSTEVVRTLRRAGVKFE